MTDHLARAALAVMGGLSRLPASFRAALFSGPIEWAAAQLARTWK